MVPSPSETVRYGYGPTPVGEALIAWTDRGLRLLSLGPGDRPARDDPDGRAPAPRPGWIRDPDGAAARLEAICRRVFDGEDTPTPDLDIRGTPFQWLVWDALRRIPRGSTTTYGRLARELGEPLAVRAVGAACAANPLALVIPCHRVLPAAGGLGGYRWGVERKRRLLELERFRLLRGA